MMTRCAEECRKCETACREMLACAAARTPQMERTLFLRDVMHL